MFFERNLKAAIMNRHDQTLSIDYLLKVLSEVDSLECLWATCVLIISKMNFDYFVYRTQHPTPFANPKTYTYGNCPLAVSSRLVNYKSYRPTVRVILSADGLEVSNNVYAQLAVHATNSNDSIYCITQSALRPGGVIEYFFWARMHAEIDRSELKKCRITFDVMAKEIFKKLSMLIKEFTPAATLSPREKEILRWSADGKTSEEIAMILGLSHDSINFHHKTIKKKTGTTNRAQAIAHAIAKGYI